MRVLFLSDTHLGHDLPARPRVAVLCGHIHRHQVLRAPGLPPVIYSGSTERTSSAEAGETKGVVLLWLSEAGLERYEFRPLPDHPSPRCQGGEPAASQARWAGSPADSRSRDADW